MGESALSLIARMAARPLLFNEYSFFRGDGLRNKEVIEVTGESGSGKSLVILDLIKHCVLPKSFGGSEAEAILIDSDNQFCIFQLVAMLESTILFKINSTAHPTLNKNEAELRKVIEESLSRLHIFTCPNLETLYLHFHYIKTFLIGKPNIGVVMLDTISSFYWSEIQTNKELRRMDTYVYNILNYFHNQLSSFNIAFIYTRPSYFQSKNTSQGNCSSVLNLKHINTIVTLTYSKHEDETLYVAEVKTDKDVYCKTFKVVKNGLFSWL